MRRSKILSSFFSATGVIILAKIFGFLKQMIIASTFGATIQTDLISLAQGFIGNLEYLLLQTLVTSFLPIYIYAKEHGEERGRRFISDALKLFMLVSVVIMAGMMVGAPIFSRVIAPSYSGELSVRLSKYIVLFSPLLVFFVFVALFRALLNANENFVPGEMVGLNQSLIVIVMVLFLSDKLGIEIIIISSYIYSIFNVLFLGGVSKKHWTLIKGNPFINRDVRKMLKLLPPLLMGYAMVYVNQLVDKMLISGLEDGAVSAMSYASTLSSLVATLIGSLCTVLFTYVTQCIVKKSQKSAAEMVVRASVIMLTVLLPISIITILCAEDIVKIVFARGKFDQNAIKNAAYALAGYGFMFIPYSIRELFGQFQYGYQDTKRPMRNSTLSILVNIIFSLILCPKFGVFGVAFATSVSVGVCGILNACSAKRHNKCLALKRYLNKLPFWMCGIIVSIMIIRYGMRQWNEYSSLGRFFLNVVCVCCGYFVVVGPMLWREICLWKKSGEEKAN